MCEELQSDCIALLNIFIREKSSFMIELIIDNLTPNLNEHAQVRSTVFKYALPLFSPQVHQEPRMDQLRCHQKDCEDRNN